MVSESSRLTVRQCRPLYSNSLRVVFVAVSTFTKRFHASCENVLDLSRLARLHMVHSTIASDSILIV